MDRILLGTFGSLGDLHPAIALALELRQRGHRAEIATSEFYREKIMALGLGFHPLRPAVVVDEALVRKLMDGNRGSEYLLRELVFPAVRDMHADLTQAAAIGADCLVTSELIYPAPIIAATTGLPWISYSLAPISLFSVFDPPLLPGPPGLPWLQSLGPAPNRFLRGLAKVATHRWWKPLRDFRVELGLSPGEHPLFEGKYSPQLDLALFSSVLQSPQSDWPISTVQCGFPFYDEPGSAPALPSAVADFLAAGPPPIVFTLGSSAVFAADDFYARSAEAARRLGRRALLLVGKNPAPVGSAGFNFRMGLSALCANFFSRRGHRAPRRRRHHGTGPARRQADARHAVRPRSARHRRAGHAPRGRAHNPAFRLYRFEGGEGAGRAARHTRLRVTRRRNWKASAGGMRRGGGLRRD